MTPWGVVGNNFLMAVKFTPHIPDIDDGHPGRNRVAELLAGKADKRFSRYGRPAKIYC
jgi:hypothetical protein